MSEPVWNRLDLGPVDSYEQAVAAGFEGTHADWVEAIARAKENADQAEAYAVGTIDGADVDEENPAYENNSKYYAERAGEARESAVAAQVAAEAAAQQEVSAWLEENITNPNSPALDRTLENMQMAAPADLVGDLKDYVDDQLSNIEYSEISNLENLFTSDKDISRTDPAGTIIDATHLTPSRAATVSGISLSGYYQKKLQCYHTSSYSNIAAFLFFYTGGGSYISWKAITDSQKLIDIPATAGRIKICCNSSAQYGIVLKLGVQNTGRIYGVFAKKVAGATAGHLAALNASGDMTDSGKAPSDFLTDEDIDGMVTGPASATNERIAVFDGTTGKLIKDGGKKISDLTTKGILAKPVMETGTTTASAAISKGQYFFIGESLYVATAAIAKNAQLVYGSNYTSIGSGGIINVIMREIEQLKSLVIQG